MKLRVNEILLDNITLIATLHKKDNTLFLVTLRFRDYSAFVWKMEISTKPVFLHFFNYQLIFWMRLVTSVKLLNFFILHLENLFIIPGYSSEKLI